MYLVENQILEPLFPTLKGMKEPYNLPRQLFPEIYSANGYMEIIKPETILDKKSVSGDLIFPWIMDADEINDIDTWADLEESEEKQLNSYIDC
jgi:N-acylneuraminate cytidylyltransferase